MKILMAIEGTSDVRRLRSLLDCWLADNVSWFSPEHPDGCREFIGIETNTEFVEIKRIPKLRRDLMNKQFAGARFGGPFPGGDAGTIQDLRILLEHLGSQPDVVLWIRDSDGHEQRGIAAKSYVRERGEQHRFVLGYAQQAGEAWVLAGWLAKTEQDKSAAAEIERATSRKLPRDAHTFPHHGERGVKWAAAVLRLQGDREIEALVRAWRLDDAAAERCGLAAFRRELTAHVGLRRALGLAPMSSPE